MLIKIICVNRLKDARIGDLINEYIRQTGWNITLIEVESKLKDSARVKQDEATQITSKIDDKDFVILMDELGKNFSSTEFSEKISEVPTIFNRKPCFVIGGAQGLDKSLKTTADMTISLGKQTLPHILARLVLVEQIYRAWSIYEGRSYHK